MEQILFEVRVVCHHARDVPAVGKAQPGVMRGEGRLHVDQVKVGTGETAIQNTQFAPVHQAVFRIEWNPTRGQAHDLRTTRRRCVQGTIGTGVFWRHRGDAYAKASQRTAEGFDRRRYPIDAGMADIADHQNPQTSVRDAAGNCP